MGVDAFVVRHRSSGAPQMITRWTTASIINAGDGWHQHPTQALLDCYTIRTNLNRRDGFDGLRIAIVGDIKHSRVARSNAQAFTTLGAHVTLVAPPTLLPPCIAGWPVDVSHHLDDVLADLDVLYLLRVQRERMDDALLPSLREYSSGPMNRGVEMVVDPGELPGSVILDQVTNGVAVRMAVLFQLLGTGGDLRGEAS
jgi:aspartate carbamoyltransferase catalytic subunit